MEKKSAKILLDNFDFLIISTTPLGIDPKCPKYDSVKIYKDYQNVNFMAFGFNSQRVVVLITYNQKYLSNKTFDNIFKIIILN